ncbi:MAG: aspartate kinase [Vicinamibacterales bacterium]
MSGRLHVLKFGGTSVATPERLRAVVDILVEAQRGRPIVCVVSAMAGVTSALDHLASAAGAGARTTAAVDELLGRHRDSLAAIACGQAADVASARLDGWSERLRGALDAMAGAGAATPHERDLIMSMGERLVAPILAAGLESAGLRTEVWDGADIVRTNALPTEAAVDDETTASLVRARRRPAGTVPVVTGYVGGDPHGRTTLLGRGGSDYTAAIVGAALGAERVEIWTDVDGIMSADPRIVPSARLLPDLTFDEASHMAFFGAKVLHPRTTAPLLRAGIPFRVRNSLRPHARGTEVGPGRTAGQAAPRAVSSLGGLAEVVFDVDADTGAPAVLRAVSSCHGSVYRAIHGGATGAISLIVDAAWLARYEEAIVTAIESATGVRVCPGVTRDLAAVAVVGGRATDVGVRLAAVERTLAVARVPHLGVWSSGDAGCVAALVGAADLVRATGVLHARLVTGARRVSVVLAGATGQVGSALVAALAERAHAAPAGAIDLRLVGAFNSRAMAWSTSGLDLSSVRETVAGGEPLEWSAVPRRLACADGQASIFVDCSASDEVAERYEALMADGVAVVTPNKRANAGPMERYRRLSALARRGVPYGYETTVGAALPVIGTIRRMVRGGDTLRRFQGVLSGTLAFVFARVNDGVAFSDAVRDAAARGFTEPHPADDLGGEDVARKLVILLREAGFDVSRDQVDVESLVPPLLAQERDPRRFLAELGVVDETWRERAADARRLGERLVYRAAYDGGRATVGLTRVPADSPLANVRAGENVLVLHTRHYDSVPLTIAGPGAGPAVTASGVLADIDEAARALLFGEV